jgi:UDPglucose 6-dehydrogenase
VRVLIIGAGVVGKATAGAIRAAGHFVEFHDPPQGIVVDDTTGYHVALLCVPTPEGPDGANCRAEVLRSAEFLHETGFAGWVGIRSTVTPGTCAALQEAYPQFAWFSWPEFLREKTADYNARYPDYVVCGARGVEGAGELRTLLPTRCPVYEVTPTHAEFVKYATNCLLAATVGVCNELAGLGERLGFDWNEVMPNLCSRDPNLPKNVRVIEPGGFGGKCLPKDLAGLLQYAAERHGETLPVLQAVHDENRKRRDDL